MLRKLLAAFICLSVCAVFTVGSSGCKKPVPKTDGPEDHKHDVDPKKDHEDTPPVNKKVTPEDKKDTPPDLPPIEKNEKKVTPEEKKNTPPDLPPEDKKTPEEKKANTPDPKSVNPPDDKKVTPPEEKKEKTPEKGASSSRSHREVNIAAIRQQRLSGF